MTTYKIKFKRKYDKKWKYLELFGKVFKTDAAGDVQYMLNNISELLEEEGTTAELKVLKDGKIIKQMKLPKK